MKTGTPPGRMHSGSGNHKELRAVNHPNASANQNIAINITRERENDQWTSCFLTSCSNSRQRSELHTDISNAARSAMSTDISCSQMRSVTDIHWKAGITLFRNIIHSTSQHNTTWWSDGKFVKKEAGPGAQCGTLYST